MIQLSIIIVNWNSKDYLKNCLRTVIENTRDLRYEIIVIDSGSFDGCRDMLIKFYPEVRFIQSKNNLGFARANNEAYKISTGNTLLFLNPDTELESNSVSTLYSALRATPKAGAIGAKLLNSDKTIQESCVRTFPTILNQILDSGLLRRLFPLSNLWGMAALFHNSKQPVAVDAISGACIMIKKKTFENVGRFSEDYFMYSEDIDLCFKLRKAGLRTYYIQEAVAIHHGGKSSSRTEINTFSDVMIFESRTLYFKKNHSHFYSALYRITMFFNSLIRLCIIIIIWPILAIDNNSLQLLNMLNIWLERLKWTLKIHKGLSL